MERLKRELEDKHRREQEELERRLAGGDPLRDAEEERKRREDEEQRVRREAEEQRVRREEEEQRVRREVEERLREEEERRRREQEEQRLREDEERRRREQEARQREEQESQRREQEQRRRREEEERRRRDSEASAASAFPTLDLTSSPAVAVSPRLDTDLDALKRAELEVEKEFMAKEEAIRRALEEQERRFRMEEEARTAVDRAEREERAQADREARELALAAEQARREAEQRAREDAGRRAVEERERRAKEQEERKKQTEDERKKRERERREAEQRAREEELARRRREQQEKDRRKAEIDRIARDQRPGGFGPGKIAAAVVVGLIVVAVAVVELAPLSAYAPDMEKFATEAIGEPVRMGNVRASLFPSFHVRLSNVVVGNAQDVRIDKVTAYLGLSGLFGDRKEISKLVLDGVSASQEALARAPGWLQQTSPAASSVRVERIQIKSAKLDVRNIELPSFDADIQISPDREVKAATLETGDGHLSVEITPQEQNIEVVARGRNFALPIGPSVELADFSAKGAATGRQLRFTEIEYTLYGGQGKGTANVGWSAGWSLDGDFEFTRLDLDPTMRALRVDIPSEGMLEAKGRYAMRASLARRNIRRARGRRFLCRAQGQPVGAGFRARPAGTHPGNRRRQDQVR